VFKRGGGRDYSKTSEARRVIAKRPFNFAEIGHYNFAATFGKS